VDDKTSTTNPNGVKISVDATSKTVNVPVEVRREATPKESLQHEIGGMVQHRMRRLLVVCDMHGADLKEILSTASQRKVNIHDGRAVLREALLTEFNQMSRDIQARIDQTWPLKD